MRRFLLVAFIVPAVAIPALAGSLDVIIPGAGFAKSFFGISRTFDDDAGQAIDRYSRYVPNPFVAGQAVDRYSENVPDQFVAFAIVSDYSSTSATVSTVITLTRPDSTASYKPVRNFDLGGRRRFWFWDAFDLTGLPAGAYSIEFFVNNVRIGMIVITSR